MKSWQFFLLFVVLVVILLELHDVNVKLNVKLQYIQEVLEEQWTIMDSDAYAKIDRYKDIPKEELYVVPQ